METITEENGQNVNDSNNNKGKPMSISFAGCGFNGLYHVGVAACLQEYAPIAPDTIVMGASAGSLAAMALCLKLPLGPSTTEILSVAIKARSRYLGPFNPWFDIKKIIKDSLHRLLPEDAHERVNGRLHISLTRLRDMKNTIVNDFTSKADLIDAILCSCFILGWTGMVAPMFRHEQYVDGGISDNLPRIDDDTITISPFSGQADICPQDDTYNPIQVNLFNTPMSVSAANVYRLFRIICPAPPEELAKLCQQGFDDALRYLQRNNKIACIRCLAIQSSFSLEAEDEEDSDYVTQLSDGYDLCEEEDQKDPISHSTIDCSNCAECQRRRLIAANATLTEEVGNAIEAECARFNRGIWNWIQRLKIVRFINWMFIPYRFPIDTTLVMIQKLLRQIPPHMKGLASRLQNLLKFLTNFIRKLESKRHLYSAKFSCQLSLVEYDYSKENSCPQVVSPEAPARKISSVRVPKRRKLADNTNNPLPNPTPRKSVIKSNSFNDGSCDAARKRSQVSFQEPIPNPIAIKAKQRLERLQKQSNVARQRKSYAGSHDLIDSESAENAIDRRRSMIDISPKVIAPERVISKVNFGLRIDLKSKSNEDLSNITPELDAPTPELEEPLRSLESIKELDKMDQDHVIELANKALDWERECLEKYKQFGEIDCTDDETDFNQLISLTKRHEALMTFYYTGDDNRIRVTELFNLSPEDVETKEKAMDVVEGCSSALETEEESQQSPQKQQTEDEEDGLRMSPQMPHKSPKITPISVPPNERRRKQSVVLFE